MTATRTSPWAALGLIGGVLGVLVLAAILRKQLSGSVPLAAKSGPTPVQRVGYYALGASGVAFLSMFVLSGDAIGWAFLAFAVFGIVGLGMVVVTSQAIKTELSADQQLVTLKNVHPTFAAAVRAAMLAGSYYAPFHPSAAVPQVPAPYYAAPPMPPTPSTAQAPQPAFANHTSPASSFGAVPAPTHSAVADPFQS